MKRLPGTIPLILMVVAAVLAFGYLLLPRLSDCPVPARLAVCLTHLKQLGQGVIDYTTQHYGQLPAADQWCEVLLPYLPGEQLFQCPTLKKARSGYGLNAAVAGLRLSAIRNQAQVVLLFETEGGWNASGGPEMLAPPDRHPGSLNFLFCDGSTRKVRQEDFGKLIWTPQFQDDASVPLETTAPGTSKRETSP